MQTTIAVASPLMKNLCMSAISHLGAGGSAFIDIALMIRIRLTRLMVQGWQEAGAAPLGAGRRCCQGAGGSRACRPQHGLIALTICP